MGLFFSDAGDMVGVHPPFREGIEAILPYGVIGQFASAGFFTILAMLGWG